MLIPFHSPSIPVPTRRSDFALASMKQTNEAMLRVIDQSRTTIADTRKRIAGADALIASAAVAGHVQLSW
jgi:hypothetical protein